MQQVEVLWIPSRASESDRSWLHSMLQKLQMRFQMLAELYFNQLVFFNFAVSSDFIEHCWTHRPALETELEFPDSLDFTSERRGLQADAARKKFEGLQALLGNGRLLSCAEKAWR
jgi:hypothetical protein